MKIKNIYILLYRNMNIIVLITFLLISFICFAMKENIVNEPVASNCNSQIDLILDDENVLKQAWQASKKKIAGISISTQNGAQLSGTVKLYLSKEETIDSSLIESLELSLEDNASNELVFWFEQPVEVQLGERYNIFLIGNSAWSSVLKVDSNSNHYGCFINDTDTYQAAGINIKYMKNSKIFWVYIVLILITAYSFGFVLFFKKDFADVIGMAIITIGLIIYLTGILGILKLGIWLSIIGAFLLISYEFYYILKNKINLKDYFSPSILIWLILFFVILITNQNTYRAEWDEFSHWGLTVKDMYYSDSFSNYVGTTTLMRFYPPFLSIIQYLLMYVNNVFSENILYIAYQLMGISLMCVLLKNVSFHRFRIAIMGTMVMLMTPLLVFSNFYCTIYVDAILGVMTAYILICYFTENLNLFNIIRISLGMFALTLTKETGAVLAGITILIMFGDIIYKNKKIFTGNIPKVVLIFTFLLISFASWQVYLITPISKMIPKLINNGNGGTESIDSIETVSNNIVSVHGGLDIYLSGIINIITGQAPEIHYQIIKNYMSQVFGGANFGLGTIAFSAMDILLIILLISFMISLRGWIGPDSPIIYRGILEMLLGSIGYFGFLMIAYIFIFGHPTFFTSYGRYVGSYILATFLVFISLVFIYMTENKNSLKEYKLGILAVVLLILVPIDGFYMKPIDGLSKPDALYGYDEIAETFRGFADKSDKVYFVCNDSNGYSNLVFLNAIVPVHTDYAIQDIHTKGQGKIISVEEWGNKLYKDYQYVFILHADVGFKIQYKELFEDVTSITDGSIFKVIKTKDNTILLRCIGNVGVKDYI